MSHRLILFAGLLCAVAQSFSASLVLEAGSFGLQADGQTDDGPVIQKMLAKARAVSGPVTLRFPAGKKIYVASGTERYAFRLDRLNNLTIDGGGSTFLVQKDLRFLSATECTDFRVINLNVDVTPSPAVEAVVRKKSGDGQTLTVQLDHPERVGELGGPTKQDGEQDFFGMLWLPGTYTDYSEHYYVEAVTAESAYGTVHIRSDNPLVPKVANQIVPGKTRISLPVPGIAHRYGPGPMIRIDRCTNVAWSDVEVWSAPWFAFQIFRNAGDLTFLRVHIRPEPGSGRITSSWRDGFHVKGNRGNLLFEDCILEGMNDDAFNISSHAWKVTKVFSPDHVRMKQIFPLQFMPMQPGGALLILSADGSRRLAPARISEIRGMPGDEIYTPPDGTFEERLVPELELFLDHPVEGLAEGCCLWDITAANPHTVIRGCRIRNSCRFQSGVTLDKCDVSALLYFYSAEVEGPMPSGSVVRDCVLRQGRGNAQYAVVFNGWRGGQAPAQLPPDEEFPLQNIVFENNTVCGGFKIDGAFSVQLRRNNFPDGSDSSSITNSKGVSHLSQSDR
jgi:hypothetical protein